MRYDIYGEVEKKKKNISPSYDREVEVLRTLLLTNACIINNSSENGVEDWSKMEGAMV